MILGRDVFDNIFRDNTPSRHGGGFPRPNGQRMGRLSVLQADMAVAAHILASVQKSQPLKHLFYSA